MMKILKLQIKLRILETNEQQPQEKKVKSKSTSLHGYHGTFKNSPIKLFLKVIKKELILQ